MIVFSERQPFTIALVKHPLHGFTGNKPEGKHVRWQQKVLMGIDSAEKKNSWTWMREREKKPGT